MNGPSKYEKKKLPCKYGPDCYQKNQEHLEKYEHHNIKQNEPKQSKTKRQCTRGLLTQQKLSHFFVKKPAEYSPKPQECASTSASGEQSHCEYVLSDLMKSKKDTSVKQDVKENSIQDEPKETLVQNKAIESSVRTNILSVDEYQTVIQKLFLVRMPDDFFSFWEFCQGLSPENPSGALKDLDLYMVGPFDVLNGLLDENTHSINACRHWRYFYDPPEYQTVLRSSKPDLFHVGYYRDDPNDMPVFLGYNYASKNCSITAIGDNLFAAIEWCINQILKSGTPFTKIKIKNIKTELENWAKSHSYSLSSYSESMKARDKKTVAKTFHHAGIVVPFNKETQVGYRPLSENNTNLMKLLKKIDACICDDEKKAYMSKLHEIVTWANIAMDEGDFGTTLELGLDLFCSGSKHLNSMILQLLSSTYSLLNRNAFTTILRAHLEDRKKGDALSIIK